LAWLARGQPLLLTLYVGLIVFFVFFYTSIMFNPQDTAENRRKHGGFIPGIRPGQRTTEHLDYVLTQEGAVARGAPLMNKFSRKLRSLNRRPPAMIVERPSIGRVGRGVGVSVLAFAGLGTVSALWDNPFFIRMTPAGGWEITLLAALSLLLGLYVTIRRLACSNRTAGAGGLLGFLGVACPVCNKILLLLFGSELLLTYFEPVRVYVAALGVLIVLAVLLREWMMVRKGAEAMRERTPSFQVEPLLMAMSE
jgi:SecY